MSADTPDEGTEVTVADPEEFNQTERLRLVNTVREQAGEAIQATMVQLREEDGFGREDRQQILRAAVVRYLTEVEWLAHQAGNNWLLNDVHLGDVVVEPPQYLRQLVDDQTQDYPRVVGSPEIAPETWRIKGFNGYLTAPELFRGDWQITVDTQHDGPGTLRETATSHMPAHVSYNAFRRANQFLAQQGLDIELTEDDRDAEFNYSDLLDEDPEDADPPPQVTEADD